MDCAPDSVKRLCHTRAILLQAAEKNERLLLPDEVLAVAGAWVLGHEAQRPCARLGVEVARNVGQRDAGAEVAGHANVQPPPLLGKEGGRLLTWRLCRTSAIMFASGQATEGAAQSGPAAQVGFHLHVAPFSR